MATNVTIVALSQMVDISLNTHEGIINFQALHTLLHVMIKQLSLNDVAVEFRGSDSDRIQALISTIKPDVKSGILGEYEVITNKSQHKSKKKPAAPNKKLSLQDIIKEKQKSEEKKEKEIRVIERRKDSKEDPDLNPLPLKSPPGSLLGITPEELKTVIVVESRSTLPQYTVAVTKQVFDDLQTEVTAVKEKLQHLLDLPTNKELIQATRDPSTPIVDMFQLVNMTKRLDASEIAIQKLASLIEEVAKHGSEELLEKITDIQVSVSTTPDSSRRQSLGLTERVVALEKAVWDITKGVTTILPPADVQSVSTKQDENSIGPREDENQSQTKEDAKSQTKGDNLSVKSQTKGKHDTHKSPTKGQDERITIWRPKAPFSSSIQNVKLDDLDTQQALKLMQDEFNKLNKWVTESIQEMDRSKIPGLSEPTSHVVEAKINEYAIQLEEMNSRHITLIENLSESYKTLEVEMNDIVTKLDTVLPGGDSTGINAETTMDLANKLAILEKEMLSLAAHAEQLDQEKKDRDKQTESLMEEIDVLKIVKANREDLEDALGDKADACLINRKVSHDQFDAACDDLTRGIEEALGKLEEQEEMWQQTLTAIQREVGNKLDKMEVDPLKDFVNSKLRALQEKFKSLTALKREQEAAGTKNKLLRNVNCISCDKDVVMRTEMDVTLKPKPYAMPPNRNMAPYLAYELDQLRKQQKCVPGGRNLNFIESALKTTGNQGKNHICNRYCGGSHTVTTPQQRVTRLGHFLDQWGPEIAPLQEEYIKGKDNQMYRAREESLYNQGNIKGENQASKKQSMRPSKAGDLVPTADSNVAERDTMVNAAAQEAIMRDENQRSMSVSNNKKVHNIGTIPLNPQPEVSSNRTTPRGSQVQEGPRPSQAQEGPRGSQAQEGPRGSQAQEGPRGSQAQEGPRGSQAQEGPRGSQVQEGPRGSQAPTEQKSGERGSRVKILEHRTSQSGSRPSQVPGAGEQARPSKAGSDAKVGVQIVEHRESRVSRKGSQQ